MLLRTGLALGASSGYLARMAKEKDKTAGDYDYTPALPKTVAEHADMVIDLFNALNNDFKARGTQLSAEAVAMLVHAAFASLLAASHRSYVMTQT